VAKFIYLEANVSMKNFTDGRGRRYRRGNYLGECSPSTPR